MPTIPTGKMERELRALYLRWVMGLSVDSKNLSGKIDDFQRQSEALIQRMGGRVAALGALGDFPAPKLLELSPVAGKVYDQMKQSVIQAGLTIGLNSREAAQAMFRAGMDKSYRRLERLARTETTNAYWKNAFDSVADLPALVMVWGSEDGPRTCDWCRERDGLVMDSPNLRDHPNGRCTPIPTLRSQVHYRGSISQDGQIYMDPAWMKSRSVNDILSENKRAARMMARETTPEIKTKDIEYLVGKGHLSRQDADMLLDSIKPRAPKLATPAQPARPRINIPSSQTVDKMMQMSDLEAQDLVEDLFRGRSFNGFSIRVDYIEDVSDGREMLLTVLKDGDEVGGISRIFKGDSVYHNIIALDEGYRGQGFSSAFSEFSEAWYKKSGLKDIMLSAQMENGGYTWAKAGYRFDTEYYRTAGADAFRADLGEIAQRVANTKTTGPAQAVLDKWSETLKAAKNDYSLLDTLDPQELANLMDAEGSFIGKTILNGTKWHGRKVL